MSDRPVTLDDFWLGRTGLASVAAQLLTVRTDAPDSIWAGDSYGSSLVTLASRGGSSVLVRREIERVLEVTERGGVIEAFADERTTVRTIDARLAIAADTVTEEG